MFIYEFVFIIFQCAIVTTCVSKLIDCSSLVFTVYNVIRCKRYKHIQVSPVWNQVFNKVNFLNVNDRTHVYNLPVSKAGMYRHLVYNQMCQ